MKKVLIAANVAFLCIIYIQCSSKPENKAKIDAACNNICNDYSSAAPFDYLSLQLLGSMCEEYNRVMTSIPALTHIPVDNDPDARSVWLPLDKIERFIWEIRSKTCNSLCDSLNLGIRIYYGRYKNIPAYPELKGMNPNFEGRHTLFMMPTFRYKGGDYDFDPRFWRTDKCLPKTLYYIRNSADSILLKDNSVMALTVTGQNHGSLCPPLCKPHVGDDFFTEGFIP